MFLLQNSIILNDDKDAVRRIAEGDASPVASPPKAEVESEATMTAKPSARLRRGETRCHTYDKDGNGQYPPADAFAG